jgi:hypothetical protein
MKNLFLGLLLTCTFTLPAQVIMNAYAKVTAVTGSSVLTLSNVNQTNHTFAVGERVIVMQMQDDVIGTNTTNAVTFGNLSAIANAGNYEIRTVSARTPATGTPTSLTLTATLANTYDTGTNSSVQLITYRYLGNTFTTTADITALAWDGNVGGVIGLEVNNIFTLNHRIIADGLGFAGGARSADADETCVTTSYRLNDANKGYKGDGIYKRTTANQTNGRAKILNGGGGGSENNSGGGGGGNFTAGGNGGLGYQCTTLTSGYGLGGITLSTSISGSRVFMGGGGGGGQMNNDVGTNGGNGGGIILIKANILATNATCTSSIRISAEGEAAANSGNDGSGGGGAGGSIVLQVNTFSITSTCPLINSGSGGNGGSVTDAASHGGGGGGGQGVVIYSIPEPTANVTTSVSNGAAGSDSSGGNTSSGGGGGTSGTGVVTAGSSPLPINLVSFSAETETDKVKLLWTTASEKNNAFFTIEKSVNGIDYTTVSTLSGAGTSESLHNYVQYDNTPYSGVSYYRLKQTDFSAEYKYSPVISVDFDKKISFSVYPNPTETDQPVSIIINKSNAGKNVVLHLYDLTGKELFKETILISDKALYFNFYAMGIEKGIYLLKLESDVSSDFKKLIIK